MVRVAREEPEHLIFFSRNHTPLTTANVRRRLRNVLAEAGITGPVAEGSMSPEMAAALAERQALMESRALALAQYAIDANEPWLSRLGASPSKGSAHRRWLYEIRTVAAYRDRYQVEGRSALGEPRTEAQKVDAARADQAIRRARALAEEAPGEDRRSPVLESRRRAIG